MGNQYFDFKQFRIRQDRCAMKVGTDGVLLGAWCSLEGAETILDIGTGTGLIALMAAQRCPALVYALEPDSKAYEQARENARESPWRNRVICQKDRLQEVSFYEDILFDRILCNPPFFAGNGQISDAGRSLARQKEHLPVEDLATFSTKKLKSGGTISLILPAEDEESSVTELRSAGFHIQRLTRVLPTPAAPPGRILLEAGGTKKPPVVSSLVVEKYGRHKYSEEYVSLTREFYLHL